jgi:hypothetical protein
MGVIIVHGRFSSNSRSESTTETTAVIAGFEKPMKDLTGQPVAETEVRESKSHDRHVMVLIYGFQMERRLESDSH